MKVFKFMLKFSIEIFTLIFYWTQSSERFFFLVSFERNIFKNITTLFSPVIFFFPFFSMQHTRRGAGDPVGRSHAEAPLLGEKRSDEQTSDTVDFLSLSLVVPPDTQPAFFLRRSLFLSLFFSSSFCGVRYT